jgi:hypothetical protein
MYTDLGDLSEFGAFFNNLMDKKSQEHLVEGSLAEVDAFCMTGVDPTPTILGGEIVAQSLDTTVLEFPTSVTEVGGVATPELIPGAEV